MTQDEVVAYMKTTLGPIVDAIHMTDEALNAAADYMLSVYGGDYASMTKDSKFMALAEFFAINGALNFAVSFYKFSADGATVEGDDIFQHLNVRWQNALSMAQTYLTDVGLVVTPPGAAIAPKNYGWRMGGIDTNYLQEPEAVI